MRPYKGVLSWTVLAAALVFNAEACLWCDTALWLNFQDCFCSRMRNEPSFLRISAGAFDDMRNSIAAASQAIANGRPSMKMKMLVGAMAGELSDLIRPMSSNGNGRPKAILMDIVRGCSVDVIGRPDSVFMDELGRTLDFMMSEPSYDNPRLVSYDNDAFPQNAVANPTNFNGQNINNPPTDFNDRRQQQSQRQLPPAETITNNAAPYRGSNQQTPRRIPFPNNQYDGSRFPAQGDINTASLTQPSQPQITNANGARDFNTFNQNPSINPSITYANAASNSYSNAQNPGVQQQINSANFERRPDELYQYPAVQVENANVNPGSRPYPLNPDYFNQPQITRANAASSADSYNVGSASPVPNTNQNIPQNNIQNQIPLRDFISTNNQVTSYPTNNLQNQQLSLQSINQPQRSFGGSEAKTLEINAQNVPQNYQNNQFNQYSVSNGNVLGQSGTYSLNNVQRQTNQNNVAATPYNELPPNYNNGFPNHDYPNNPEGNTPYGLASGSAAATNSNSQSFITQGSGNFPGNYPGVKNKPPKNRRKIRNRTPNLKKRQQNKTNVVTNQKSLLTSPNDDDEARAMRFVETFYVILSQSSDFKSVFNEQIPNDQALSLAYTIDVGALNDCGYSQFSVEIADACTVLIESLPDGCPFVQYAEAISKAIMKQLYDKKLIGQNPEDQAKCIANNLLTRLNQNLYPVITTTTMQFLLDADTESSLIQGPGSQPQATNANPESYSNSLNQNPDIQPQSINTNGARIYSPNADQSIPKNNLQNLFLGGNNVPVNNAVPSHLINKPQNQLNFAPGSVNQQPDSSTIASYQDIKESPNHQNMDRVYTEEGMKNAAFNFYQKLSYDLLSYPYISSIYNEKTTKSDAKSTTATLLLGSLSADYDNLAIEIARVCIKRLGKVPPGSNTEVYTTLIATCITDGFSYYGLISQENPTAQASEISSKIIAWLKEKNNNGNNNQLANGNINAQSNLPNQGAMNYPDSYSGVPNLNQGQQPASSETLASNSRGVTDYNSNTDNLAPQYLSYNNQNIDSNSQPITNDGLQNIRTSSNTYSSSVKTNINNGKNKKANRNNRRKSKRKRPAVTKSNFNFENFKNNNPYNDYPVNNATNSNPNSNPDISNGDYFRDYNGNLNYQPNNVPNTQWPKSQNYPTQNVNQDYVLTSGATKMQNDNISGLQQGAFSSDLDNSPRKKKCKNLKNGKGNNATNRPVINDDRDGSNYPLNQMMPSTLGRTNNPQTFQSNEYTGSPNNEYDAIPYQNTTPVSYQSQIIPNESNDEVKDRIRYLTKGILSSMSNGKFDYKCFSNTIAELSKILQTTHPELGSQTSLIKTLIDSIIACTQMLIKIPPNYFDDGGVLQNSDIPDAAAIDYSKSVSPIQGDQITLQTNKNNVAFNVQSYGPPTLPPKNYLNNDQIDNFNLDASVPLPNTNVPPQRQGSVNNVALNDQSYGPTIIPQQNNLNNDQIGNFYPGSSPPLPNSNVPPERQVSVNNVDLKDQSYRPPTIPQQNNLNNDKIGNFYPGGSPPLPNNNVPLLEQGSVNNAALRDQNYGPSTIPLQNNFNSDQIGNFYPGRSPPLLNNNVPPQGQGSANNVALSDQSYGPLTLQQQNNFNNDQIGQRNFYPGGSASLPNTDVPPRQDFGIQSLPQGVAGNGPSNSETYREISPQIGQDNSPPTFPTRYGSQNLPLNNQNNLAFQPSGDFNNPNLQSGNTGNQNVQLGNSFQTGLHPSQPSNV